MAKAAEELVGLTLAGGWTVTRSLGRPVGGSGGFFSQAYEAVNDGKTAFVKALDFSKAFEPGKETLEELGRFIAAFQNERDVLDHCSGRRLSHVSLAIAHGFVDVPGHSSMEARVYYLIFDMAKGDIRSQMSNMTSAGALWCMEALRAVALGLWQVHRERIAHQDMKPSNVLNYPSGGFKITDFGRASQSGRPVFFDDYIFPGDWTYAPPELCYRHVHPDFVPRRIGGDLFMLGNIAVFLFTGANLTATMFALMDPQHHPNNWGGTYAGVLPYVQEAFGRAIDTISPAFPTPITGELTDVVKQLCEPDLARRGHPRGVGGSSQYFLERYVSLLDRLQAKLEVAERLKAKAI